MTPLAAPVVDDRVHHRFFITENHATAVLVYRVDGDRLYVLHTEVPEAFRGHGVGGRLVAAAVERAVADGLTIVPWCPYARQWLEGHAPPVAIDWELQPS